MVDFNIFEGLECHGVCKVTISRGEVLYENGEVIFNQYFLLQQVRFNIYVVLFFPTVKRRKR